MNQGRARGADADGATASNPFIDRVLVFTDIEGSSERWDAEPDVMRVLMRHHDTLITEAVATHGGLVGARTGDGAIALFERVSAAVRCAMEIQARIGDGPNECELVTESLRIRIGVHRGVVERRDNEHYGPPMHRTARVMATGHGGQIVLSEAATADLQASGTEIVDGIVLVDRGKHRLKGFHEAERLTEVCLVGQRPDPRGLRVRTTEGSLPPLEAGAFIGREDDVERIVSTLAPGTITTLVGPGGVGKTRLALHVARSTLAQFPDGAWFIDLAAAASSDRVLPLLADTLGLGGEGSGSLLDRVRLAIDARHMLVILDNCEHVLDAVRSLVRSACTDRMGATILATSQRGLDVAGEQVEIIGPLATGDELNVSPAGRLFLMAAERSDPQFALEAGDIEAVGEICRRLDGLPLALELAAARVRVMPVQQIAAELRSRLDLLRSRDHHERHRTMAAAITWSIDLLDDHDRSTLLDLSVFSGTFDWNDAAAVSGADRFDVIDSIEELARRSLLTRRGDAMRMLVPLRLHCGDELERTGRAPEVRSRHATWIASRFSAPLDDLDPVVTAGRIDRAVECAEDIHAAHTWLVEHDPTVAAVLALNLGDAWVARSRSNEALVRLSECDLESVPPAVRVDVLGWIAMFAWTVGHHDEGEDAARRALAMAATHGLPVPVLAATRLAVRCAFSNRTEEAVAVARDVEAALLLDDRHSSRVLGPIGVVHAVGGDTRHGVDLADQGVDRARRFGSLRLLTALSNRILLEPASDEVTVLTAEVAELARVLGRTSSAAYATAALAHQARRRGDVVAFVRGVGEFADLMLRDEPTSVVQMLLWVPPAVVGAFPRDTAVLLSALEALGRQHDYVGSAGDISRREELRDQLRGMLGDRDYEHASTEGALLSLPETVDRLHWIGEALATR